MISGLIGKKPEQPSEAFRYRWGGEWISFSEAREHFAIVGSTGSGKTVLVRLLLQSVVPHIGRGGHRARALIYDAKIDMVSKLSGMGATCPIMLLNPMDQRSWAWEISADILSIPDAEEFAATLIPEQQQDSQPYFANTARALLGGVVTAFILNAKDWTLRDIVLSCRSKPSKTLGVSGLFFQNDSMQVRRLAGEWIFGDSGIKPGDAKVLDFIERPPQDYLLPDWTLAELDSRIRIPALKRALMQPVSDEPSGYTSDILEM